MRGRAEKHRLIASVVLAGCVTGSLLMPTLARAGSGSNITPILTLLLLDSDPFIAKITGKLNDTGIDWGGDDPNGNNTTCTSNISAPQDCHQGRDHSHDNDSDGHAGFSFVKIDRHGDILPASATSWDCVGDKVTGLMWEVKKNKNGVQKDSLHDADDTYTWYNTDNATNGGAPGSDGAGKNTCYGYNASVSGTFCNTEAYVNRVNDQGWCGHSDWRLPALEELAGIVDFSRANPSIDPAYLPNTLPAYFWSASSYAGDSYKAWNVYFLDGPSVNYTRKHSFYARLVRGGQ